jgi:glycosyltransferase involved in cell wall biosynthesis
MKILYAALRHDPTNPDLASGVDYNFHSAFVREGAEVRVVGPFHQPGWLLDRALNRFYRGLLRKRYLKWNLQITRLSARALNRAEREWKPDLVFGLFPPPLAFYRGQAPAVFNTDTTLQGWQDGGANFGALPLKFLVWQERRTVRNCALTITFSEYCKRELIRRHGVEEQKVFIQPMPSALPAEVVPTREEFQPKRLTSPLELLLVGRDYQRKGIPTAIQVVQLLNQRGVTAKLTICGLQGSSEGPIRFAGLFRKSVPEELQNYAKLYRGAHLLIHPAVFEPAGIVPAEAAAFGVPTITNDVGGLASQVAHGISGIVLPGHSPAEAYVDTIVGMVRNPDEYQRLSIGARKRYEREQNWEASGKCAMRVLEEVVTHSRPREN